MCMASGGGAGIRRKTQVYQRGSDWVGRRTLTAEQLYEGCRRYVRMKVQRVAIAGKAHPGATVPWSS